MKKITILLSLLFALSVATSISHATLPPISVEGAELLLNNIEKDRDAVLQDTFQKLLEAYGTTLASQYPKEVLEFMAFCSAGKLVEIFESMSPIELTNYSKDESRSKMDDEKIATECWNELQNLIEAQKKKSK